MIRSAVNRPIATAMAFLGLVLIGVVSVRRIPVDLLPEINYPRLTVVTVLENVEAADVERLVTVPLEAAVSSLPGVRRVESHTREGLSTITVEYDWGEEMNFAALHLREALDRVVFRSDFPEEAERPLILRWDPGARPISILVLEGEKPLREITEFAEQVLKPALEQIHGLAQAEVVGGLEREIRIEPDPERMRLYGLSIDEIARAVASSNVSFPGGKVRQGPLHLSLRIVGEFASVDEIAQTAIRSTPTGTIRVGDVADVIDGTKEPEGMTVFRGRDVASLLLYKEVGANTVNVAREVDRVLGMLRRQYPDFSYTFIYRDAEFISASFEGLLQSLVVGAGLAFLVLFLFLRGVRSPLVVGVSIPVSIAATFGFLYLGRVNLNLMSLGGLSLAAGMLVDNAIIVLESTARWLEERKAGVLEAAVSGAKEVGGAVLASTLTTVAVFFPVVYVPGVAGEFFRDQALTVTFSLLVSVATALLLQPALSARLLAAPSGPPQGLSRVTLAAHERLYRTYHAALEWALAHKAAALCAIGAIIAAGLLAGFSLERSFLPARRTGDLSLFVELPAGTPLEQTREVAVRIASWLEARPEVASTFLQVGTTERTLAAVKEYTAPHTARIRFILHPRYAGLREVERLKHEAAEYMAALPALEWSFRDEGIGLREILGAGEAPFSIGVTAERPELALDAARRVFEALSGLPGLVDLRMDRVLGTPNIVLRVDREEAVRSGLDPEVLVRILRDRIRGVTASTFNESERRVDIAVRLPESWRKDLDAVLDEPIEVRGGKMVALSRFVHAETEVPVRELVRLNQQRMIRLSAGVEGRRLDRVMKDARARIAALGLPPEVRVVEGSERREVQRSFKELGYAFLLAALIVYMILAAMFESFLDPLLIAAVLPAAVAGAAVALALFGQSVNVLSLIGLIALAGIGVNDAIVKTDAMRRFAAAGMPLRGAVLEASRVRFRPVVMTSVTTIVGMIPMAVGLGSGEQLQRALALTIIGGLAISTVLTLFLTPILYEAAHGRSGAREGGR